MKCCYFYCVVCVAVTLGAPQQPEVNVDRLFHANPPTLVAGQPSITSAQKPSAQQEAMMGALGDIFDDDFIPYRGSRHDEFDFALTKV